MNELGVVHCVDVCLVCDCFTCDLVEGHDACQRGAVQELHRAGDEPETACMSSDRCGLQSCLHMDTAAIDMAITGGTELKGHTFSS